MNALNLLMSLASSYISLNVSITAFNIKIKMTKNYTMQRRSKRQLFSKPLMNFIAHSDLAKQITARKMYIHCRNGKSMYFIKWGKNKYQLDLAGDAGDRKTENPIDRTFGSMQSEIDFYEFCFFVSWSNASVMIYTLKRILVTGVSLVLWRPNTVYSYVLGRAY